MVVERSGPFVGSLIASLPTSGAGAMIILGLEDPPEFIATSAVGGLVANAACALFALTYTATALCSAIRRVVVLRDWPGHWTKLELAALGCASAQH